MHRAKNNSVPSRHCNILRQNKCQLRPCYEPKFHIPLTSMKWSFHIRVMFQALRETPCQKEHIRLEVRQLVSEENVDFLSLAWNTRSTRSANMKAVFRLENPMLQKPLGRDPEVDIPAAAEAVQSCPPLLHSHMIWSFLFVT